MPYPPVILLPPERRTIGFLALESLAIQNIEVLALAVTIVHVHFLARCPADDPPMIEGRLKHHATKHFGRLVRHLYGPPPLPPENPATAPESPWRREPGRRLWAIRGREKPIRNRDHQLRAFAYILDHIKEGGWIWDFRRGPLPFAH